MCVCTHESMCECMCASASSSILKEALLTAFFTPHLTFPFHPSPCSHPLTLKDLGKQFDSKLHFVGSLAMS